VQSLVERSVDIVRTVDLDRWEQAGQRGRGFDSGEMPLASAAATKPPDETPT
jgi:hypothetical protein